jgi:hypothetical protein
MPSTKGRAGGGGRAEVREEYIIFIEGSGAFGDDRRRSFEDQRGGRLAILGPKLYPAKYVPSVAPAEGPDLLGFGGN